MTLTVASTIGSEGYIYSDAETLTLPTTGPFVYTSPLTIPSGANSFAEYMAIKGGLLVVVSLKRKDWTNFYVLGSVPPLLELSPGDTVSIAYTALTGIPSVQHWAK